MNNMTPHEYLKDGVIYDNYGQKIFYDGNLIADIRGWGTIRQMFESEDEAATFQDQIGQFIADAINEKIKREGK